GGDVLQDSRKGDRSTVDQFVVFFRTRVELGPNFSLVGVQNLKSSLNVRPVKHTRVGDEHHLYTIETQLTFQACAGVDNRVEVAVGRWFAISRKSDVVQAA